MGREYILETPNISISRIRLVFGKVKTTETQNDGRTI
jgi:hypothetical protein